MGLENLTQAQIENLATFANTVLTKPETRKEALLLAKKANPDDIQVKVIFPAIREGDMPANVKAIAEAMTLDNKGGQVVGIDEKVGVGLLAQELGVDWTAYGKACEEAANV